MTEEALKKKDFKQEAVQVALPTLPQNPVISRKNLLAYTTITNHQQQQQIGEVLIRHPKEP
ncbi:hypothetical protein CHS0354_033624, partial [Potamilus streckersoni]